jgi:hypothetical protein
MRTYVLALLGAALVCGGCIQADEADDQESVETAEQPIFADPPPKTGFLFIRLLFSAYHVPAVTAPSSKLATASVALASADDTNGGDDDDDGDPR